MKTKKAFTLIELLVVIAIIALLLSVLLPALKAVKKQAQEVVCKSNLHQWALTWVLFADDNKGKFPSPDDRVETVNSGAVRSYWAECLSPYLGEGDRGTDIYLCPSAKKGNSLRPENEFSSFNLASMDAETSNKRASYGINCWVYNRSKKSSNFYWRSVASFKQPSHIPILLDSKWRGGIPFETDKPLLSGSIIIDKDGNDIASPGDHYGEMGFFQMKRHKHGINGTFGDNSIRSIEPKELWLLKWHGEYEIPIITDWPDWMD